MKTLWILTFTAIVVAASGTLGWCRNPKPAASPAHPGMAAIPAGEFLMGSLPDDPEVYEVERPKEQPQHKVWVDAFYLDRHEVTNVEYSSFDLEHVSDPRSRCPECPATVVSWFEARAYCARQGKRLPTEAEWEKAAKGGATAPPKPLGDYAWYLPNADGVAHPVGKKKPNQYGLYDMLGNAREWTADWFDATYYARSEPKNPPGPREGTRRVERGGAFFLFKEGVNATIRYNHPPEFRLYFLGFRCAQDP